MATAKKAAAKKAAAKKTAKKTAQHPSGYAGPEFAHIHCSSRFDRSAASLEADLDNWMENSSIVTLTEISNDKRAQKMQEKGWAYYNAKKSDGQDECGIAWRLDRWKRISGVTMKLNNAVYYRLDGRNADPVVSASVVLRHRDTGHRLLVSVTHMPAHVEGAGGWRTTENKWQARKNAYTSSMTNLAAHIQDLWNKKKPDAVMVVADWNLNLKETWVRNYMRSAWGTNLKQAWLRFPTAGGSMSGGVPAPLGAPGAGTGDRIIDGTLYRGLKVDIEPNLMARVASSDHRPYKEGFAFSAPAGNPTDEVSDEGDDAVEGDIKHGEEWWGFGDYMDDEIYQIGTYTGKPGGEIL